MNQTTTVKGLDKYCELCDKILHGRSDQRFCNDTCRNTFNRNKLTEEKIKEPENMPEILNTLFP